MNHSWYFFRSLTNITTGLRPFAPRTPGDINIEDVVKFSRQGGKLSQGKIKFVGHLPGRSDIYLGVELDKEGKWTIKQRGIKGDKLWIHICHVHQFWSEHMVFFLN